MLRSYFDNGFPRSLSTSRNVNGKFLLALCLTTLNTAAFVLFVGGTLAIGLVPGTASLTGPCCVFEQSVDTLAAAVDGATSILSKLNSLWERRSSALYVVNNRRRI